MQNGRNATGKVEPGAVQAALDGGRLLLALQPIVDAKSLAVAGYEGLLRMRGDDGAIVTATALIEDAERAGEIEQLDCHTLEMGLAIMGANPDLRLSLNVSGITAHDALWLALLRNHAAATPDLPERLTIEITETAMIRDIAEVAGFIDGVRALGCRVAIDDFGAGYTSFRHLKSLRVDMLKIDGAFVDDLPGNHQSRVIARTMIDMARALGLVTVAEWVATEEAAAFLRESGVDYLQGFLYGEPKPVAGLPHIAPAAPG